MTFAGHVAAVRALVAQHGLVIPISAIAESGLPPSAAKHAAYWGTNPGGRAARALGYKPRWDQRAGVLRLTPDVGAMVAAAVAPPPPKIPPLIIGAYVRVRADRAASYEGILAADELAHGVVLGLAGRRGPALVAFNDDGVRLAVARKDLEVAP